MLRTVTLHESCLGFAETWGAHEDLRGQRLLKLLSKIFLLISQFLQPILGKPFIRRQLSRMNLLRHRVKRILGARSLCRGARIRHRSHPTLPLLLRAMLVVSACEECPAGCLGLGGVDSVGLELGGGAG